MILVYGSNLKLKNIDKIEKYVFDDVILLGKERISEKPQVF